MEFSLTTTAHTQWEPRQHFTRIKYPLTFRQSYQMKLGKSLISSVYLLFTSQETAYEITKLWNYWCTGVFRELYSIFIFNRNQNLVDNSLETHWKSLPYKKKREMRKVQYIKVLFQKECPKLIVQTALGENSEQSDWRQTRIIVWRGAITADIQIWK